MHFLEAYKRFPSTDAVVKIYELRGRKRRWVETTDASGKTTTKSRGKVQSYCVAAGSLYDAVVHLREVCPDFYPNHVNCCGTFYPTHRFPFGTSLLLSSPGEEEQEA
jgi:hypothetical protein